MTRSRADVGLRRPPEDRPLLVGAISCWDVIERKTGRLLGTIARDDAALIGLEGTRHLWHAWTPESAPGEPLRFGEALPMRYATREDAVDDVLLEAE